jgi:hypothetical protein
MSTRSVILAAVARDLGWGTGSISSGGAQTAVLGSHIGGFGDDHALMGWTLVMPDAATSADQERTIETWDDSAGAAYWVTARTDTTYTSETYFLVPPGDYARQDIYTAINDSLTQTRITVPTVLPTIDSERLYRLGRISWLRSREDVDAVFYRASPNLVDNSQFDVWGAGTALAPTSWVLAGASATVARATAGAVRGYYGVTLTRVGADATLTQTVGLLNGQLQGEAVSAACYVRATVATRARIGISDGLTTTYSSYHTGGGGDELLTVSKTLSATGTNLQFVMSVDTGDTSATFNNFVAMEGSSVVAQLTDTGDEAYRLQELPGARIRQVGDQQAVALTWAKARRGQIVVYSAQPYPSLSSDTASTLCPDDVIVPGAVYELVSRMRKGQERDRLEILLGRRRQEYLGLARTLREYPVVPTRGQTVILGA